MSVRAPLCIELYCGSFGWSRGWLKMGGRAIGFDWEHHPWHGPVPENAELVLQDVLTLNGAQFKDADLILASPPCQEFSYRAMPWKRAKVIPPDELGKEEPEWWGKTEASMTREERREWDCWKREHPRERPLLGLRLFWRCFQIQAEAIEATRRTCAACEGYGGGQTEVCRVCKGRGYLERYIPMVVENVRGAQKWVGPSKANYGSFHLWGDVGMVGNRIVVIRDGLPDMRVLRMPGKARGVTEARALLAVKTTGHVNKRDGFDHTRHLTNQRESEAVKHGGDGKNEESSLSRRFGSKSDSRKAASAMIAIIPPAISQHIAECFWPAERERYQPQPTPEAEKSGNEEVDFLWKWACIPCGKQWDAVKDERGFILSVPCPACGAEEYGNRRLTYELVARTVPASA